MLSVRIWKFVGRFCYDIIDNTKGRVVENKASRYLKLLEQYWRKRHLDTQCESVGKKKKKKNNANSFVAKLLVCIVYNPALFWLFYRIIKLSATNWTYMESFYTKWTQKWYLSENQEFHQWNFRKICERENLNAQENKLFRSRVFIDVYFEIGNQFLLARNLLILKVNSDVTADCNIRILFQVV